MTGGFRQSTSWVHTWVGLLLGSLLYFIFLTGTAGYFDSEIDRWMRPELPPPPATVDSARAADAALRYLNAHEAGAERWTIQLPGHRDTPHLVASWPHDGHMEEQALDADSGEPLATPRETGGGQLLYRMHWRLHYLPAGAALWLVGAATVFLLVSLVSGVVAHKRFFSDFFTFRAGKGQRSWLDAHNVLGVMTLPFQFMITYSGLIFFAVTLMPWVVSAHYGAGPAGQGQFLAEFTTWQAPAAPSGTPAPLAPVAPMLAQAEQRWGRGSVQVVEVLNPGDASARVQIAPVLTGPLRNVEVMVFDGASGALLETRAPSRRGTLTVAEGMLGLHEGLFAGPVLRWLYALSGLLGTAMVATGLVLWTVKRRQKLERDQGRPHRGLRLVERLNVATVFGLPVAIGAYFWANRLLPIDLADRAGWEAHALFIAWGATLLHACLRPPPRAWVEQGALAAGALGLLPVLNALTDGQHLGASWAGGDWAMAGFDLTALALGSAFAWIAWRLHRRARRTEAGA